MEIYLKKGIKHTLQFQKAKLFVAQSHLYKLHWQVGINFIDRLSFLEECHVKNYDYGNRKKKEYILVRNPMPVLRVKGFYFWLQLLSILQPEQFILMG